MTEVKVGETPAQATQPEGLTKILPKTLTRSAQENWRQIPWWLIATTAIPFIWIFFGTPIIIGVRMWNNSPIHPSFALFGASDPN